MERLAFNSGLRYRMAQRAGRDPRPPAPTDPSAPTAAAGLVRWPSTWAWRGTLLFTAVLFLRPQDTIPHVELLHLAECAAIVGILGLVFGRMSSGLTVSIVTPEVVGMLAFAGAMLVGIPFSFWPGGSMHDFNEIFLKVLLVFILMVNTIDRPERLDRIIWVIVLCAGYISLRAVIDYGRGVHLVEGNRIAGAVGGIFGNPNDLALNMVVFMPFAVVWGFREGSSLGRGAALFSAVCMLATIILTRSRGGALGLVAMIVLLMIRSYRVRPAIPATVLVLVLASVPMAPASFWDRMSSITDESRDPTGSREARKDLLKEATRVFLAHPVFGIGLGQFVNFDPDNRKEAWRVTHNATLQVAAELGILGLVPFGFLIYRAWSASRTARRLLDASGVPRRTGRAARRFEAVRWKPDHVLNASVTALTPSLLGWFVCAQFASIAFSWTFYYILALAVATREIAVREVRVSRAEAA